MKKRMLKWFSRIHLSTSVLSALGAAILFGASTPVAKALMGTHSPILIAGLLYFGSGVGLMSIKLIRDKGWISPKLEWHEWVWLLGAMGFGGILAPTLLMYGLTNVSSANASLLLNLEAVLTAVIAWVVFKENADNRIICGMTLIVAGGLLLPWPRSTTLSSSQHLIGSIAIAGACLAWAIDNNLTRKISASDSVFIAGSKGLTAGLVNLFLAYQLGSIIPTPAIGLMILLCGFLGYGLSLLLFILALRGLGTARTGAYFSVAPFIGAGVAILFFQEPTNLFFWLALLLMAVGVWLHLTEVHDHEHIHEATFHEHYHVHDEHHQHSHDFEYDGKAGHSHPHQHTYLIHTHHHYPDVDHRHDH